ncbi:MAG: ethylbenzene dehydrogenase-related protein [Planctomycetota bacterium]|jgi:hypothetical protein
MNNKVIVIVILISVGIFAGLVSYGWSHRYGSPETYKLQDAPLLKVSYQPRQLALKSGGLSDGVWRDVPGVEVKLHHQATEKPWPKGLTPLVKVQAFHNGTDIYFKMTWPDDRPDSVVSVQGFPDGCAVAVPMETDAPLRSIMMGFSSPVNIWHWQADKDIQFWENRDAEPTVRSDFRYPFEQEEILSVTTPELKSAVADMLAQRAGSLTDKTAQRVQGRGLWNGGSWSVVFSRSLTTDDSQFDCQFPWGKRLAAFAVWDGDQDQRGGRKSMSQWVTLQIDKPATIKAAHSKPSDADVQTEGTRVTGLSWMDRISSFSFLASARASIAESQQNRSDAEPRVIMIEAKRFEYVPSRISVRKGEVVTLRMESLDVTHGLYLDGYGVNIKANPGVVAKATFVADKPGRFTFRCSETCGEFHPYMVGFLEVTPNRRFNLFLLAIGATFVVILGVLLLRPQQEKGAAKNAGTE